MAKPSVPKRQDYSIFYQVETRWMDNDVYGHINNVVYYSYFDSITNRFLIEHEALDIHNGEQVGLMVHSQCFYHEPAAFPDILQGGFRVKRIGNSSVEYELALFKQGKDEACTHGTMTHVFVNKQTQTPVSIEGTLKAVLSSALCS
ncbi:acyl-CoA thioesterase [Glaciecola sp. 2405UD65-10]|uniref:acyl-CoA thioesterase n=1 Tax=Glaciecola sp. 2405UD65-10 TaxID=3397244 RepID=UPI003B5A145A